MIRDRLVPLALAALVAGATLPPRPSCAAPTMLADSSRVERWTLANGLRVVTRHIPRAHDVAITVGYRSGMDDDPPTHQGLSLLLGDLGFTAATADQPARTTTDLDRDLPLGWSDPVMRHLTLFTESLPRERMREALAHAATRMRGVKVDAAGLDAAIKRAKRELGQQYFGDPSVALGFQAREIGSGLTDAQMLQRASGAGLTSLSPAEVKTAMDQAFVPANAALSIAGDLHGVDQHAEIERLFGPIPGGTARPDAPERTLTPAERTIRRQGEPAAVIGLLSPPLSDSTHATFYMAALLFGGLGDQTWSAGNTGAHRTVLQYGLFDEPELVRLYPPVKPREVDLAMVDKRMSDLADMMRGAMIPSDSYDEMRSGVTWLMGGPMNPVQRSAVRSYRPTLMTLSRAQASCELRRGPVFWQRYLRRMMDVRPGQPEKWGAWFTDQKHQVRVLSLPSGP